MRSIERRKGYFVGMHNRAKVEIERIFSVPGRNFLISVRFENGAKLFEGYSSPGVTTMEDAKREAIREACLGHDVELTDSCGKKEQSL
jgi:hypothetical protein